MSWGEVCMGERHDVIVLNVQHFTIHIALLMCDLIITKRKGAGINSVIEI